MTREERMERLDKARAAYSAAADRLHDALTEATVAVEALSAAAIEIKDIAEDDDYVPQV